MLSHFVLVLSLHTSFLQATGSCRSYLDTFEDLQTNAVAPQFSSVETYHDITYQAFDVVTRSPVTGAVGGLQPVSGDNLAGFTMLTDLLSIGSLTFRPFGYLIAANHTKSFNLNSLYFGCNINTHSPAVQPNQACTMHIVGYYENGAQGPVQTYSFSPTSGTSSPMQLVNLPSTYQRLSRVVLSIASAAMSVSQGILNVDNVQHCNYA